jgi:hypothetical protein
MQRQCQPTSSGDRGRTQLGGVFIDRGVGKNYAALFTGFLRRSAREYPLIRFGLQ